MLLSLKKMLLIIDVFELCRLVKKTNESKKLIKDKEIILVLGKTGNGKTTTILKFLGNNFKKTSNNNYKVAGKL